MRQRISWGLPLAITAIVTCLACLTIALAAAAPNPDCGTIVTAANQLEVAYNQVQPYGYTPFGIENQIQTAAMPLMSLASPAAFDMRNWAFRLASELGKNDAQDPDEQRSGTWISGTLSGARQSLQAARAACA
ncbi:hypothetical protein [Mycobacterium sp. NPDC050853]|uniref:hypothetical protein n=1 Tax=Mycobacterium sp. NPDC050853 TaxID=3155160 RepID=UPI0033DF6C1B